MLSSGAASQRFSGEQLGLMKKNVFSEGLGCFGARAVDKLCVFGKTTERTASDWLVWGDSHSGSLLPIIHDIAKHHGSKLIFAGEFVCPPLIGIVQNVRKFDRCKSFREVVMQRIETMDTLDTVIIVARWPLYVEGRMPAEKKGKIDLYPEGTNIDLLGESRNAALVEQGLTRVRDRILASGKRIILVGSVPEIPWNVSDQIKAQILFNRPMPADPHLSQIAARQGQTNAILERVASVPGVTLVPIAERICTPVCPTHDEQKVYYSDENHLTPSGARLLVAELLSEALAPAQNGTKGVKK